MQVRLEVAHAKANHKKVILKRDTLIGRSAECNLRIASKEVSRKHCRITLSDDGVMVRDLGSSNGTFVNGYKLDADTDYTIAPDSELSVGGVRFVVRYTAPAGLGSTVDLKKHATETEDLTESEVSAAPAAAAAALAGAAIAAEATDEEPTLTGEVDEEETILSDQEEPLLADEEPLFADEDEPMFVADEPGLSLESPSEPQSAPEEIGLVDEDEPILAVDEAEPELFEFEEASEEAGDELDFVAAVEPTDSDERTADLSDVNLGGADVDGAEIGVDDSGELVASGDEVDLDGAPASVSKDSQDDVPILVDEQPEEAPISEPLLAAGDDTAEALDEPLLAAGDDEDWLAFDDEPAAAEPLAESPGESEAAVPTTAGADEDESWGFPAGEPAEEADQTEAVPVDSSEDDAFAFLTEPDDADTGGPDDPNELGDFLKSLGDK
jgi:hypothetical protein